MNKNEKPNPIKNLQTGERFTDAEMKEIGNRPYQWFQDAYVYGNARVFE